MQKYYKHQSGNFVWVMEIVDERNERQYNCLQYVNNGNCPIEYITSKIIEDEYWIKITEDEAEKLIANFKKQKELYVHRKSELNMKWADQLVNTLKDVSDLRVSNIAGVVKIDVIGDSYRTWEISRSPEGNITSRRC